MASRHEQFVEDQRKRAEGVKRKALEGSLGPSSKQPGTLTSRSDAFRQGYLKSLDNINELGGIKGGIYGPASTPEIIANSQALAQQRAAKPKTQYQQTQEEINKMPPGVKQFASVMNWITAGNPVGNFLSQATNIPVVSVTTPDSTGSKVVDTIGSGIGKFVGPVLMPSGAPLGSGTLAAPYAAAESALASKAGQKAVDGLSKVIPKVKPETAQNIARGALTEGIAGAVQAPAQTLLMDSGASAKELALNTALGAGGGFVIGGAAGSLSGLFKKNGIPSQEVADILALPEPKAQARMREAAARSKNAYGSDPIANPFTHELPEASPKLKSLAENTKAGRAEVSQIDRTLNELESQYEQRVIEVYKFLKSTRDSRKGVQQGSLQRDAAGEVIGRTGRMSENPLWYQEFYSQNGRVPSNKDLYQLARDRVDNGFQDESGLVPSWRQETGYDEQLAAYTAAKDNLQSSLSEMDPALNVTDEPIVAQRLKDLRREGMTSKQNKAPQSSPVEQVDSPSYRPGNPDIPEFLVRRKSPAERASAAAAESPEPIQVDPYADPILRPHQFEDGNGLGISAFSKAKTYDSLSNETRSQLVTRLDREPVSFAGAADRLYTNLVDDLHPLNQFDKLVEDVLDKELTTGESTHRLALATRGADMTARQIITDKLVDSTGKVVGDSLKDIMKGLPKTVRSGVSSSTKSQIRKTSKAIYVDFEDYLINKHAITRAERGETVFDKKLNWTKEYGAQKVSEYEAMFPEFKETADKLYEFNKQLVNSWLVDTGIISPETAQAWFDANPYYVPNKRYFSPLEKRSGGVARAKKGFGNQSVPVKEYSKTGSQRKIISPIEAIIENVDAYVKTAKLNQVMQQIVKHIQQNPEAFDDYFELVIKPKGDEDLLKALLGGDGIDELVSSLENDFAQLKRTPLDKDNIVRTLIKGEPVHVKVKDPQLLEAVTALGPKASNVVMDALGWLTNKMKTLTTGANPVFSLTRNIMRDIPHAYIASKTTNNPVRFLADMADAAVQIMRDGELYKQYKRIGGGHSSSISASRNLLAQSKRSVLPKSLLRDLGPRLSHGLENAMNAVETAPRLAEFKRASAGGDLKSALFEAQDLTVNFKRRGKMIAELDKVFPYMNAAIQGLDQFVRLYKDNPVKATVKAFLALTVPGAVMYAVNHNNPDYQKVSNRVKDNFLLIPKGDGTFWKIAKPKELGTLFIDLPERLMRKFGEDDPAAFRDFADQLRTNFLPPGISGAAKSGGLTDRLLGAAGDTIIGPVADLAANQTFSGSPIVPGYLERKSPGLQADTKTTSIARWIGDKTYGTPFEQSPMKLDYLARQYLGVLGQFGQPLLSPGGDVGSSLSQQVTADPVYSNDISTEFYTYKDKLDQAYNDRELKDLPEWYSNGIRKRLDKLSDKMSEVRKQIRSVQADKVMSKADKRARLRELQDKINTYAGQGNELARGKVPYK